MHEIEKNKTKRNIGIRWDMQYAYIRYLKHRSYILFEKNVQTLIRIELLNSKRSSQFAKL